VGYRAFALRLARELGLDARAELPDDTGLSVEADGSDATLAAFAARLGSEAPALARIDRVEPEAGEAIPIERSAPPRRPDLGPCARCAAAMTDPFSRHYRHPFTRCAACGPWLSPAFDPCPACRGGVSRCGRCGPRARLVRLDGRATSFERTSMLDDVDAAGGLLQRGETVAIQGFTGFTLARAGAGPGGFVLDRGGPAPTGLHLLALRRLGRPMHLTGGTLTHAAVAAVAEHALVHDLDAGERPAAPPLLGLTLGPDVPGDDGTWWGGFVTLGDRRVATLKPVAALGDDPLDDLHAHLDAAIGWPALLDSYAELEVVRRLEPRRGAGQGAAPQASSFTRLVGAVAATLEVPAGELDGLVSRDALRGEDEALAYPFACPRLPGGGLRYLEPRAMWSALLGDLILGTPPSVIAARFHRGLARGLASLCRYAAAGATVVTVTDLDNRVLAGELTGRLAQAGFQKGPAPCASGFPAAS
jgi:hydrogenase maturation factor HypF (carbamoyltransferase family)